MKQLFLGLIALNLCYLLFQQFSGAEDRPTEVSEVAPAATASAGAGNEPAAAKEAAMAPKVQSADSPPVVVTPPAAALGVTRSGGLASVDIDSSLAIISPSSPAAEKPVVEASVAKPLNPPVKVAIPSPTANCAIVGPFRRRSQAEKVVDQLAKADVQGSIQPRDVKVLPDYMVYVGPQADINEARTLDAAFKAANRDSQIIASGSLRNALSLGVFSRGPLARELQQEMQAKGYEARIATITRNRRGFQVRTQLSEALRRQFVRDDTPFIDCPQTIAQR